MVAMQSFSLWPRGCGLSLACYWYLNLLIDYQLNHKTANLHCFSGQFCETMRNWMNLRFSKSGARVYSKCMPMCAAWTSFVLSFYMLKSRV